MSADHTDGKRVAGIDTDTNAGIYPPIINNGGQLLKAEPGLLPCPAVFSITAITPLVFIQRNINSSAIRARQSFPQSLLRWLRMEIQRSIPAVRSAAIHQEMPRGIFPVLPFPDGRG